MQNQQQVSKSAKRLRDMYEIYAKMLAVENIKIVFDATIKSPANFDIPNRILRISPIVQAQEHLIPGIIVHEVGHALFSVLTPAEAKKLHKISKLLNIIDDGYQERKMCKKYPNGKKHLLAVFNHFFVTDVDETVYASGNKIVDIVNTLNFNCKGIKHGQIRQYPAYVEQSDIALLRQGELIDLPSFLDRHYFAEVLAKALLKYGEIKEDENDAHSSGGTEESDEGGEEGEDGGIEEEADDGEEEGEEPSSGTKPSSSGNSSLLDDILEREKKKLNDHHSKIKMDKTTGNSIHELLTGKELVDLFPPVDFSKENRGSVTDVFAWPQNHAGRDLYASHKKEAKKIGQQIYTRFNQRVQASNFANSKFAKSGTLDSERAALYLVDDDIFVKELITPNVQNHAYAVVLDWSGSMRSSIPALCLRVMELAEFAKLANIEVEVYLYTTCDLDNSTEVAKKRRPNTAFSDSLFIKIINTRESTGLDFDLRMRDFWYLCNTRKLQTIPPGNDSLRHELGKLGFCGTNILEGLMLGHHALSKMTADKKTCFVLSDGDDCGFQHYSAHTYTQLAIFVGGADVSRYDNADIRVNSASAVADVYRALGHKTVGIAWNTSTETLEKYCQPVISATDSSANGSDVYNRADNVFISQIVQSLL